MYNQFNQKIYPMKCEGPIKAFAIAALVPGCAMFAMYLVEMIENWRWIVGSRYVGAEIVYIVINLMYYLSYVLFAVYVLAMFEKGKGSMIPAVIFGMEAMRSLLNFLVVEIVYEVHLPAVVMIRMIINFAAMITAVIFAAKRSKNKIPAIVAISIALVLSIWVNSSGMAMSLMSMISCGTYVCLLVSMLIFFINNTIPYGRAPMSPPPLTAEQMLFGLNSQLQQGLITQEEYTYRRSEILQSLANKQL